MGWNAELLTIKRETRRIASSASKPDVLSQFPQELDYRVTEITPEEVLVRREGQSTQRRYSLGIRALNGFPYEISGSYLNDAGREVSTTKVSRSLKGRRDVSSASLEIPSGSDSIVEVDWTTATVETIEPINDTQVTDIAKLNSLGEDDLGAIEFELQSLAIAVADLHTIFEARLAQPTGELPPIQLPSHGNGQSRRERPEEKPTV